MSKKPKISVFQRESERLSYARYSIGKPEIDVYHNRVIVCGKEVSRPESVSPYQWLEFWERVATL